MKNNIKKRVIFVTLFIILCCIYFYVNLRGEYLEIVAIGEKYADIFETNISKKIAIFMISFIIIYIITYITTIFIKKGLKPFFIEEKKEMPKLPNKSISLAFGIIGAIIITNNLYEQILLCFSNVWFGQGDPIFNLDIAFYMFIIPFAKSVMTYTIILFILLSIYIIIYYILAFNKYFNKGISFETLKKSKFLKQLIFNLFVIISSVSILVILGITDISTEGFMRTQDGTTLYGAGLVEITIKGLGYLIFSIFIIVCTISATKKLKRGNYKKAILKMLLIPSYLLMLLIIIITTEFIYLRRNEYDKEKEYIVYNINNTKKAYNIEVEEINVENKGTITTEEVESNQEVIKNINLLNEEVVLENLKEYNTNLGYYNFNRAQVGYYNNELVYVSPREILSNNTRTYNNKTYQYTHGFDVIITSASQFETSGLLKYKRNSFNKEEFININEPRIYFGLQTDEVIVTNAEKETEYDYPLTSTINMFNTYNGKAGIHLNFVDRLILGIKERNLKLAFSSEMAEESNIIIKRNVVKRAESILPYVQYDQNPYLIISDDGRLVWVLDAYTTSDKYPYSQKSTIQTDEQNTKRINYIRNSLKVFIDAYDGTMEFYITDRTDPIIMAYWSIYPTIFEDINSQIPEKYKNHLVYPEYLYNIQAKQIARYHNIQPEVLYRADDVWSISKEREENSNTTIKDMTPYYTLVKTLNNTEPQLGLVIPYTISGKQNITSYLVGTDKLTIYRFVGNNAALGTTQLERLIEEDTNISKEIEALNVSGTKIEKELSVIPINDKLLYVESIFQVLINENQVPILKKVIVASGDKLSIGDNLDEAISNLLSQEAVEIEIEAENIDDLIKEIIQANKNLEESNKVNDWEMIGKDIERLQELIKKLEELQTKENEEKILENIF